MAVKAARACEETPGTMAWGWKVYQGTPACIRLAESTRDGYRRVYARVEAEVGQEPSARELSEWFGAQLADHGERTVHWYRAQLLAVATEVWALTGNGELARAIKAVRLPRPPRGTTRCPPTQLIEVLLRLAARNPGEVLCVRLAAFVGLRIGEIVGLRPEDWSESRGVLTVERSRSARGIGPRKNGRGKCPQLYTTPDAKTAHLLSQMAHHWMRQQVASMTYGRTHARLARQRLAEGYFLPWSAGYPENLINRWRAAEPLVATWLPKGKKEAWHNLRHWWGCVCYEVTGSERAVQQGLGQSTPQASQCYSALMRGDVEGSPAAVAARYEQDRSRPDELFPATGPGKQGT